MKHRTTTLFVIAFLALSASFHPVAAQQTGKATDQQLQVKCVEKAINHLTFQVDFSNETGDNFFLSVKDESGNMIYGEKLKDKNFSRRFKWNNEEGSPRKLIFALTGDRLRKEQTVEVANSFQVVQDVVISRLK